MTRRNFMLSAAALAGMPSLLPTAPSERRLRVGILSDIHVEGPRKAALFEKSLRYFDAEKVDAVLIAGDLTVHSQLVEHRRSTSFATPQSFPTASTAPLSRRFCLTSTRLTPSRSAAAASPSQHNRGGETSPPTKRRDSHGLWIFQM